MASKRSRALQAFTSQSSFKQLPRAERKAAVAGFEIARAQAKEEKRAQRISRRKVRREAKQAKKFFQDQVKGGSGAVSNLTSLLRKSKSVRGGRSQGIQRVQRLRVSAGWSDMGLIFGTGFKDYQSRNVFPSSRPDRTLHPQEKAEIASQIHKIRLFGASQPITEMMRKKKEGGES